MHGAALSGSESVTISKAGTYVMLQENLDSKTVVDVGDSDDVHIVQMVTMTSTNAAITTKAGHVYLTLVKEENTNIPSDSSLIKG